MKGNHNGMLSWKEEIFCELKFEMIFEIVTREKKLDLRFFYKSMRVGGGDYFYQQFF